MSRYGRIFGLVLTMIFCLSSLTACGAAAEPGMGATKELQVGDKAPDFTAKLVDGSEFKMSEHDDEVVLINFFASWCGPCMGEMPVFDRLKSDNISNFSVLCINCEEEKATVDTLVKEKGYTFPVAYDEDGAIGAKYPTDGIPYTLVIKNGVIEKTFIGAGSAEEQYKEYKGAIDACMK
ncbi:MAG: TlpA family protein disulfide reductase [Butyrivibrio sp.]|nr:TlpA family protein disulfide reductase [Butyrivibrio sp.]